MDSDPADPSPADPADSLLIDPVHRGPARSGNGGWTAGALATRLAADTVEVTLRRPPPLARPLRIELDDRALLWDADELVAEARAVETDLPAVEPVSYDAAVAASAAYPGHVFHPFPTCYVCGTARPDGLRIFPGPAEAGPAPLVAAPWTPPEDVEVATAWAALDCTGGWAGDLTERLMVLGRMTATIDAVPRAGEPHVVTGRFVSQEGRKTTTAATLYDADGRIVGRAAHVWIAVDPAAFN